MHLRAAELFGIDDLANGRFHERRAGQIQTASLCHQDFVAKDREISSAGHAVSHDGGKLRNPGRGNDGVVAEDPAEIVFIGKNFVLERQKNSGGINEVDDGQRAFERDSLRANQFLDGLRKECPRFHAGIVGNDHAGNSDDASDTGHATSGRHVSPFRIHFVGRPKPYFEKRGFFVEKMADALSRRQPAHLALTLVPAFTAAFAENGFFLQNFGASIARRFTGRCRSTGHRAKEA